MQSSKPTEIEFVSEVRTINRLELFDRLVVKATFRILAIFRQSLKMLRSRGEQNNSYRKSGHLGASGPIGAVLSSSAMKVKVRS